MCLSLWFGYDFSTARPQWSTCGCRFCPRRDYQPYGWDVVRLFLPGRPVVQRPAVAVVSRRQLATLLVSKDPVRQWVIGRCHEPF